MINVIAKSVAGLVAIPIAVENETPGDDVAQCIRARRILCRQLSFNEFVDWVRVVILKRGNYNFLGGLLSDKGMLELGLAVSFVHIAILLPSERC